MKHIFFLSFISFFTFSAHSLDLNRFNPDTLLDWSLLSLQDEQPFWGLFNWKSREDMDKLPSAYEAEDRVGSVAVEFDPHPMADTPEYAIYKSRVMQEMMKNPKIYLAFEFAGKGPEGWEYFEKSEDNVVRNTVRFLEDARVGVGVGGFTASVSLPGAASFSDLEKLTDIQEFQPHLPNLQRRATQLTDMFFSPCKDQTFNCPEYQLRFQNYDMDIFAKAFNYAASQGESWPVSQDLEVLTAQFPNEALLFQRFQDAAAIKDIREQNRQLAETMQEVVTLVKERQAEENYRVAHISPESPFLTKNDRNLLELNKKGDLYQREMDKIEEQIKQSAPSKAADIKGLQEKKDQYEQAIKDIEKAKKLYRHKKFVAEAGAWSEAGIAIAQLCNAPKEVIQIGRAGQQGLKIFDAVSSMLIKGALDPTGITAIASGVSGLMKIAFGIKSTQEVMMEKLDEMLGNQKKMLENQRKMLENQMKMLGRLNEIENKMMSQFKKIEDLLQTNHKEILANQETIQDSLNSIQVELAFGFAGIKSYIDTEKYKEKILVAKKIRAPFYDNPGSNTQIRLSLCQINESHCDEDDLKQIKQSIAELAYFDSPSLNDLNDDLSKKIENEFKNEDVSIHNVYNHEVHKLTEQEKSRIEKGLTFYLNNHPEYRIGLLKPMVGWLNTQLDLYKTYIFNLLSSWGRNDHALKTHIPTIQNRTHSYFQKIKIPQTAFPGSILVYPSLHDELFSELVNLSLVLPPEYDRGGQLTRNDHTTKMCKQVEASEYLAKTMRKYIPTAWAVFVLSHLMLHLELDNIFRNEMLKNFRHLQVVKDRQKIYELRNHITFPRGGVYRSIQEKDLTRFEETIDWALDCETYVFRHNNNNIRGTEKNDRAMYFLVNSLFHLYRQDLMVYEVRNTASQSTPHRPTILTPHINHSINTEQNIMLKKISTMLYNNISPLRIDILEGDRFGQEVVKGAIRDIVQNRNKKARLALLSWGYWKKSPKSSRKKASAGFCENTHNRIVTTFIPDTKRFMDVHLESAKAKVKEGYRNIFNELYQSDAFLNFLQAKLALDTVVKLGYGQLLYTHPDLSFLNHLINELHGMDDHIELNFRRFLSETERTEINTFLDKLNFPNTSSNNGSALLYLPAWRERLHLTSQKYTALAGDNNPLLWIPKNLQSCVTKPDWIQNFRTKLLPWVSLFENLQQIKQIQIEVEEEKQISFKDLNPVEKKAKKDLRYHLNIQHNQTYDQLLKTMPLSGTLNSNHLKRLTKLKDIIKKNSIKDIVDATSRLRTLYDSTNQKNTANIDINFVISELGSFRRLEFIDLFKVLSLSDFRKIESQWESTISGLSVFCEDASADNLESIMLPKKLDLRREGLEGTTEWYRRWRAKVDKRIINEDIIDLLTETNSDFSLLDLFPIHLPYLPPESTWDGQPVGLGNPELRHEAFKKASLFEQFRPQDCHINVQ